jgi:Ca2+-binding RTX toxin-like protein
MPVINAPTTGNQTVANNASLLVTRLGGVEGNISLGVNSRFQLQGYLLGTVLPGGSDFQVTVAQGGFWDGTLDASVAGLSFQLRNFGDIAAVISWAGKTTIVNNGSMAGGIFGDWSGTLEPFSLDNRGSIFGAPYFNHGFEATIRTASGHDRIANSGVISGLIDLGSGNDSLANSGTISGIIFLSHGNDTIDTRNGLVEGFVSGGNGNDVLLGGAGGESMQGGNGDDWLDGGAGHDTLIDGDGANTLLGGDGNDRLSVANTTFASNDLLDGGNGDDLLQDLTGGANTMLGGDGRDTLRAGWQNDLLDGGDGADMLHAGGGADTLLGGQGNDSLFGGDGNESLDGGTGADLMIGGRGDDIFVVDDLGDRISESANGSGTDTILLRIARFSLGGSAVENATGDIAGLDFSITGNSLANRLVGRNNQDSLIGLGGADELLGLAGNDSLDGGSGNDGLDGGAGHDTLLGGAAHDMLRGDGIGFEATERFEQGEGPLRTILSTPTIFVDFDRDGDLDIVGQVYSGLAAWRQNDDGSYTMMDGLGGRPASPFPVLPWSVRSARPALTDLDADGDLDLVYGAESGTLGVYARVGTGWEAMDGAGGRPANPFAGISVGMFSVPVFVDLDMDGGQDLVVGAQDGTLRAWLRSGTGTGTWTPMDGIGTNMPNPFAGIDVGSNSSPAFTDLDGDGDRDLVVGAEDGTLRAWEKGGFGRGVYTPMDGLGGNRHNPFGGIVNPGGLSAPSFVDLDRNGEAELVLNPNNFQSGLHVYARHRGLDSLDGGTGNDTLDGGGGADTMAGGSGDDLYVVDDAGDVVVEVYGGGLDSVLLRIPTYSLVGTQIENVRVEGLASYADLAFHITGNHLSNILEAGARADTLDGGAERDVLWGGLGNDSLMGGAAEDTVYGEGGDDTLDGGDGADRLTGDSGRDSLVGGAGDDTLNGGAELDMADYGAVAGALNLTATGGGDGQGGTDNLMEIEILIGGSGADTINFSSATFSATLMGSGGDDRLTGGSGADNLFGGTGNDSLSGGGGNDTLDGFSGADTMLGGAGDDTFFVGDGDVVREDSNQGNDTVLLRRALLTLAGTHVENVRAEGLGFAVSVTGNSLGNLLAGSAQADTLNGDGGHDTLEGRGGADLLIGGTGQDIFVFDTALGAGVDTIQGYSVTDDTIRLDDDIFTAIGAKGSLAAAAFQLGAAAREADDRIIYDNVTGMLRYDADGNGSGAAVQIATLTSVTGTISHSEFSIF